MGGGKGAQGCVGDGVYPRRSEEEEEEEEEPLRLQQPRGRPRMDCSLLLAAGLLQWVEAPKPSRFPNCHMTGHNVLENLRCFGCSSSQKNGHFPLLFQAIFISRQNRLLVMSCSRKCGLIKVRQLPDNNDQQTDKQL